MLVAALRQGAESWSKEDQKVVMDGYAQKWEGQKQQQQQQESRIPGGKSGKKRARRKENKTDGDVKEIAIDEDRDRE